MLVLSRRLNQKIRIGEDIVITITKVNGSHVGIGIEAPRDISIRRDELPATIRFPKQQERRDEAA